MKKSLTIVFSACCISCVAQQVPFFISLEQVIAPDLPYIHSYAKAQSGDKWLIVAGRVDGLHSLFPNLSFSFTEQNNNIFVVDTSTWNVWESSLNNMPYEIRRSLSATNTEYRQSGNNLYIIGGYGYDSLSSIKKTFPTLTALNVDGLINEIASGGNNISQYVRQISDTAFAVTGGKLEMIGSKFYLTGGQYFAGSYTKSDEGLYTQRYTNAISYFDLEDDGVSLSFSNLSSDVDTVNFHRRDLNAEPWISSSDEQGFATYGGVFQYDHNLPFRNPVYTTAAGNEIDFSFEQKMSQYQCPVIPLYDSVTNDMYSIFAGGISLYFLDSVSQALKEDTLVPFIRDVSALVHHSDGTTDEVILPVQFPERGEANAEFFANPALEKYENGVLKLRSITEPVTLGFIYGGITSAAGNDGSTSASNKVYRIRLYPDFGSGIVFSGSQAGLHIFPNPCDQYTRISISSAEDKIKSIEVQNGMGKTVKRISVPVFSSLIPAVSTGDLAPGIYTVILKTDRQLFTSQLAVVR